MRGRKARATWRSTNFHDRVADFGSKLIEADEQLRQCAVSPDVGTIESVLTGIETTARNYVESRSRPNSGWPASRAMTALGRDQQRARRGRSDAGRRDQGHLPGNRQLRL